MIYLRHDQSKIMFSFQHNAQNKSLLADLRAFAERDALSMSGVDVIVMNRGNAPHYHAERRLLPELKAIVAARSKSTSRQLLLIMSGDCFEDTKTNSSSTAYAYALRDKLEALDGLSVVVVDMPRMTEHLYEVKGYENRPDIEKDAWVQKGHYCQPGLPAHFMLFYWKLMDTFLAATF